MRIVLHLVRDFGWLAVVLLCALGAFLTAMLWTVPTPSYELFFLTTPLQKGVLMGFWHTQTLFLRVNEHLTLFPMLVFLLPYALFGVLPPLTESNLIYVNAVSVLCSILGFAALLAVGAAALRGRPRAQFSLAASVAACVGLSLSQWELWTTSTIAYTLTTAAGLSAIALLTVTRQRLLTIVLAALLCTVATCSFANGVVSWIACCVCVTFQEKRVPRSRWYAVAWCACTLGALGALILLSPSASMPNTVGLMRSILNTMRLLALPFFPYSQLGEQAELSVIIGCCLCIITLVCVIRGFRNHRAQTIGLVAVFVFGMLSAALIALGRSDIYQSRYIGAVYPCGVAVVFLLVLTVDLRKQALQGFLIAAVLASSVLSVQATRNIEERYQRFGAGKACLETYGIASDSCLGLLFFQDQPEYVRRFAVRLDSMGMLDTFHAWDTAQWDDSPHPQRGALEGFLQDGTSVTFNGWAADAFGCPARHIVLTVDEDHTVVAHTRALLPRELPHALGCSNRLGWSIDTGDIARLRGKDVSAWVYDESRDTFVRLPQSKGFLTAWRGA